ncbi:hypothetical protein RFI_26292 [Reticulomyxa filosa]|uniref:Uncharacterized protein n=1 Tax=Reticulomyxa filosa TaxID=46433 RepID=X6MDG0_RETFI|nr:hypothetical protein RFI_26292 [Reticulomyxa filosa]|eukprot:ETO11085.1 hypothetical protein RFI_26292 [Reticulomyxa filosa]
METYKRIKLPFVCYKFLVFTVVFIPRTVKQNQPKVPRVFYFFAFYTVLDRIAGKENMTEPKITDSLLRSNPSSREVEETTPSHQKLASVIKLTKLVVPFFCLIVIFSLFALIIGLIVSSLQSSLIVEVLICGFAGGLFGAWGVFKWGTIQEEIDRLKGENQKYEGELIQLRATKDQLSGEVAQVQSSVDNLKGSVDELNEQLGAFDELRQGLEQIAGTNEDIASVLDNTTKIFRDMRTLALANEKASILAIYYEVAFRDDEPGLSKQEYERFKGRLSKKQREMFERIGSFENLAGGDKVLDLVEFQEVLEKFLAEVDAELVQSGFEENK